MQRALEFLNRAIAIGARLFGGLRRAGMVPHHPCDGPRRGCRPTARFLRARTGGSGDERSSSTPLNGEAHGTLAGVKFMADYDWAGAEESFRRGLELKPGASILFDACGLMLSAQERFDEALAMQRHARELDPLSAVHDLGSRRPR